LATLKRTSTQRLKERREGRESFTGEMILAQLLSSKIWYLDFSWNGTNQKFYFWELPR